jgi:hypothetical protein
MTEEILEEELPREREVQPFYNPKGMHPGVTNGRRCFHKVNTAKKRSRVPLERALAGWDKHIEEHPRDGMAIKCRANCKERLDGMPL